jgi:excisionase family DNA binding protein
MTEQPNAQPRELLTSKQTAELIGITERGLRNLVTRGIIPAIKISGRLVRFRRSAIDQALDRLTVGISR